MFDSFFFLVKSAVRSIFKNWFLTLASVTILTVCLLLIGSAVLIGDNISRFIDEIGNENQVVLYLDETLTTEQINEINTQLRTIPNIKAITYESKELALERYKQSLGEDAGLLEGLSSDVLRNSFIFTVSDLSKFDQTMFEVEKIGGIARIREKREVVSRITQVREVLTFFLVWIIIAFIVISVLVITNTVKVSVYARRLEINIMKYVGATDLFIQTPYFLEGIIIGLFAGAAAVLLQYGVYVSIIAPMLTDLGFFTPVAFASKLGFFTWFFFITGGAIGMIGSVYPVKKYMNV